jgi:hypothetical protein
MKSKLFSTLVIILLLVSCSPPGVATLDNTRIPATISPAVPTLPPALTPIPDTANIRAIPTALYTAAELSSSNDKAYQNALHDIPVYRLGELQLNVQVGKGTPLSGYKIPTVRSAMILILALLIRSGHL